MTKNGMSSWCKSPQMKSSLISYGFSGILTNVELVLESWIFHLIIIYNVNRKVSEFMVSLRLWRNREGVGFLKNTGSTTAADEF